MTEPREYVKIIGGWAAVGDGWAVFGVTKEQARERYEVAERQHREIRSREWTPGVPWARVDARTVWSGELLPGGYVCAECGQPVESEPCPEHQPRGYLGVQG